MRRFYPARAAEAVRAVRAIAGGPVPVLTGTRREDGLETRDGGPLLSTAALDDIREIRPGDLTVRVESGVRVADLQRGLAAEGLWLAVSGPGTGRSVGGLVAGAPPGPLDDRFGPVRRQLLACRIATPAGAELRWGRAVMKNVAGYDLPALWCGSRGRLGLLLDATFRLWPLPAARRAWRLDSAAGPGTAAAALAGPRPPPVDGAAWQSGEGGERCEVLALGTVASVEARAAALEAWAEEHRLRLEEAGPEDASGAPWEEPALEPAVRRDAYRAFPGRRYLRPVVEDLAPVVAAQGGRLTAWPLTGTIWIEGPVPDREPPDTGRLDAVVRSLRTLAAPLRVAVERAPPAIHRRAEELRAPNRRALEGRVEEALGAWPRRWEADFL